MCNEINSDEKMFLNVEMLYTLSDGSTTKQSWIVIGTPNQLDLAWKEADEHLRGDLRFSDEDMKIVSGRVNLITRVG